MSIRRIVCVRAGLCTAVVVAFSGVAAAFAAEPLAEPAINAFSSTCSGTLPSTGGSCTLEWATVGATTCIIASAPSVLGEPEKAACGDGQPQRLAVSFVANTGT